MLLYVLFEHQSSIDALIVLRLLKYLVRVWERHEQQHGLPLPIVVPLLLFHAPCKWSAATRRRSLIGVEGWHGVESELEATAPRAISRRKGHGTPITFVHIFILPHTVVGIGLVLALVTGVLHGLFGTVVPAVVTGRDDRIRPKDGSHSYSIQYEYQLGGVRHETRQSGVPLETFAAAQRGSRIEAKVMSLGGFMREAIVGTGGGFPLLINLGFALFWNGILFAVHWQLTFLPLRRRRLVINGTPIIGRIARRYTRSGRGVRYLVKYEYDLPDGTPRQSEMLVQKKVWDAVREGAAVTVLYDRKRPKRSVIYSLGDYEAVAR